MWCKALELHVHKLHLNWITGGQTNGWRDRQILGPTHSTHEYCEPFTTVWPYLYSISLYLGRRNVLWSPMFDCNYYIGSSPCASPMVRTFHIYIAHKWQYHNLKKTEKIILLNFYGHFGRSTTINMTTL